MKKSRIIVVEDDRTTRKILTRLLESEGYAVIDFSEGRDAIHMAQMWPPELMLVDVRLPDMQGTRVVSELSSAPGCRDSKFLFLTGILQGKAENSKYYFEVGDKRHRALPKPINRKQLLPLVSQLVGEAKKAKAKRETGVQPEPGKASEPSNEAVAEDPDEDSPPIDNIKSSPLWTE